MPNLLAPGGRLVLEHARRLEGRRLGRCVFLEADMDALALLDYLRDLGAEGLVLVGPCGSAGEGVVVEEAVPAKVDDPTMVTRELWMNLTGSLGLDDYVAALRILYPGRFLVIRCRGESCGKQLLRRLGELCDADTLAGSG